MKNSKIIASWSKIEPDDSADERMLSAILERNRSAHDGKVVEMKNTTKGKNAWVRWAAAAACVCLVVVGMVAVSRTNGKPPAGDNTPAGDKPPAAVSELPKISVPAYENGGMGFEGLLYYSADELETGNPWRGDQMPDTLPVYKNGCYDLSGAGFPQGLNEEEMTERLTGAAQALGLEITGTEAETNAAGTSGTTVYSIRAATDGGNLTAYADGTLEYELPEGGALPEGYRFTGDDSTDEETMARLTEAYAALLLFDRPETVLQGQYSFSGSYERWYFIYDFGGDEAEGLRNYCFRTAEFVPDESGDLKLIRLRDGLCKAEKLGDYPVITLEEARKMLLEGRYQTSAPEAMPGEEYIVKAELVYRAGAKEETLLPYYRFFVELQDIDGWQMKLDNGLNTYGVYYVPAIPDDCIADFPTYEGSFN